MRKSKFRAIDIAIIAVGASLMFVSQIAMSFLPNIELVSLFIIVFTKFFNKKTLFMIYIFALAEGLAFGFGIWWLNYMYVWTILYLIVRLLKDFDGTFVFACVSGLFGLFFGALCSIPYFFTMGIGGGVSYFISGLGFDFLHCIGNFVTTLVLYKPLCVVLEKAPS